MYLLTLAFAQSQTPGAAPAGGANFLVLFPMYLLIFLVFYFFLIRPQQKREQEKQSMISQLKKNDEVITSGGIHGTVVNVKEKTLVLRVDDNVKMEVEQSAVAVLKKAR
ncbi:MAG: preprotein translocase subunit YajC [Candidatus Omnitrophica bacterium]|nr:preprotein translocase subunit YajC [Candidatus Omnitrophota bacterium]MBU1924455.1 preprotein translocase subunit YajC [Candidatus Omnitrophota bacterium]MBU2063219.1 preprotein translocase subunit YajC [Candidatus Omnitrophota bacterium]